MEIVVVGAGVFGAWTALLMSRAGHRVTLIDQAGPANTMSSSAGESRIIRSAYGPDEIYTLMARRSLQLWIEFFREENRQDYFRETGVLWMAKAKEPGIRQAQEIFNRHGIVHDWLDAHAITKRYPQFEIGSDTVALFEPNAGALLAERALEAVVASARRTGVTYETAQITPPAMEGLRLRSIESRDGRRFSADHFIFACGSWLPKLFRALEGIIRPTRQDLFYFSVPEHANQFHNGAMPIWVDQAEPQIAYGFPDLGSGLKMGFHRLGPPFDPDMPRHVPQNDVVSEAADYVARRLPCMRGARLKATQICHYENTPNGDFLLDLYPAMENAWLIGGGSGHGFKHGPAIAEYILDAIEGTGHREFRFSLAAKQNAMSGRVL